MKAKARHRIAFPSLFVLLAICLPITALADVPEVSHLMITDVTTRSFSVIWASSEASTAELEIYEDPDGTVSATGVVITPHPVESGNATIATLAEDSGVMKVRATGLSANTTYYFQTITTSKATSDVTYFPESAPFIAVTTEALTARTYESGADTLPFSNDVIIEACYLDDGVTPAEGTILLATIEGANFPLAAFVGDGVAAPYALIDLNNAFSRETHENMDCSQGENLTLLNFRGMEGYSIVTHDVPQDQSLSEVKPGQFALKPGWNMVSFQLEPSDTSINAVLDPVWDQVDAAWAYDALNEQWLSIDKSIPEFLWDLTEGHVFTGYWFVINDNTSLIVNGSFSTQKNQLYPGWNLVGSKSIETVNLMEAVASIYDKLIAVWTYDTVANIWLSMDKSVPEFLWDLFTMEPGKAYWFVMNEDCVDEECQW
jgi:hypothetical protein